PVGPPQDLLDALTVRGHLPPELLAGPGELAQRLNRRGRNEAAADQPVGEEVGEPLRITHVALPPREIAHRRCVRQHERRSIVAARERRYGSTMETAPGLRNLPTTQAEFEAWCTGFDGSELGRFEFSLRLRRRRVTSG